MKISVIIVNWNTCDLLEKCLRSLEENWPRSDSGEMEIIVVDNASSDQSVEMVRRRFPHVVLLENQRNEGYACANNQAIRVSSGEYLVLLNPDSEVEKNSLHTLIRFLEENPRAGIAGPQLLNADRSLQESCYPAPTLMREFWRLFHIDRLWPVGSYRMSTWKLDAPRPVDVLKGACIILRRQILDECGLLDEDFFIYSEDQDLCRKVRRHGWNIFWVPEAIVMHHGAQSTSQAEMEMFLQLYHGKIQYFRKHHGKLSAGVYKAMLFSASLSRQLLGLLALLKEPYERRKALVLARRYWILVKALPTL